MKNIKKFESFTQVEEVNESLGGIVKSILSIPVTILAVLTAQLVDGRTISKVIKERLLNIYANIDTLITTLENILRKRDITDVERKKVISKLKELKKVKEKYPTLQIYKQFLNKKVPLYNFKNRDYLRTQIWDYEPRQMSALQIVAELTKVYKFIERGDVTGEVAAREPIRNQDGHTFQDRLTTLQQQGPFRGLGGNAPEEQNPNEQR